MPLLEWKRELQLGVEPFDSHHEHLFTLMNQTYDLVSSNALPAEYCHIIQELQNYAVYHFSAEEQWMQAQNYPLLMTHIQQHKQFLQEVNRFEKEFAKVNPMVAIGMLTFIKEWLLNHIYKVDADYAAFLRTGPN
jgi:hemerythrin